MSAALLSAVPSTDWRQFVPGPVPTPPHLLALGSLQLPYNRTETFSTITHEILDGLNGLFRTKGKTAVLTGSGTAAMEATVLNFVNTADRVLVVNGGTFGQRWVDLCASLEIPHDELTVEFGAELDLASLETSLAGGQYTALMINAHETSTGHLYDIETIGSLTRRNQVFFIVDGISSICADPFEMDAWNVDVAVLGSQKALALPPGLAFVAMGERALARLESSQSRPKSLYFDLRSYLANQRRGQLPFTPAIGVMIQLHARLSDIREQTLTALILQHQQRAESFRNAVRKMDFDIFPARPSNAMTALSCRGRDASDVAGVLQNRYHIIVAPCGGALKSKVIRVSHMGDQDPADVRQLVSALGEINTETQKGKIQL